MKGNPNDPPAGSGSTVGVHRRPDSVSATRAPEPPVRTSAPRATHPEPAHDTVQGNGAGYDPPEGSVISAGLHLVPERVSAIGLVPPATATLPTATQVVGVEHDTPDREASKPPGGLGAVDGVQVVPASVSTRGR